MTDPHTIEQLARDILAEHVPTYDVGHVPHRDWVSAAQAYLDNLAEGHDDPDELIELLAKEDAADELPRGRMFRDGNSDSYEDGPYDFSDWWDRTGPEYIAAVRVTYGMAVS
jgi:hypothetical protein